MNFLRGDISKKGFTLVELMIVIAIIGVLSSIVLTSISNSRGGARDSKRKQDLRQINIALNLFYDAMGRYPRNYNCPIWGSPPVGADCAINQVGYSGACDAPVPGLPGGETNNVNVSAWTKSMQELVNAGFLSEVPRSNGGPGYCYYDFGIGSPLRSAVVVTALESGSPSTTGVPPSCRPVPAGQSQWCTQDSSMQYCFCNPY